ncbi:MAG: Nif3-like dinuclear metal center hexameric protein [Desulfatiglandaceae bacterium]
MVKSPTVKEVLEFLQRAAPASLAESWDNPGLQVGFPDRPLQALLSALDPSVSAVDQAASKGAGLVVTHHPLFFKPVSSLVLDMFPGDVVQAAVSRGISLVSLHTNLDSARGGISDALAEMIGLLNVEVLEESRKDEGVGLGRIGNLPETETLENIFARIKTSLGLSHIRVTGGSPTSVHRIAVVGGSGGGMINEAADAGADLFLTGDVTHHQALDAIHRNLIVVDAGHFATERAAFSRVIRKLAVSMKEVGWAVEVYTAEEADPLSVL